MLIESAWMADSFNHEPVEVYEKSKIDELLCLIMAQSEGIKTTSEVRANIKLLIEATIGIKEA